MRARSLVTAVVVGHHHHIFPDGDDFAVDPEVFGNEHIAIIIRSDDRDRREQLAVIVAGLREQGVDVAAPENDGSRDITGDDGEEFALVEQMLDKDTYGAYGYGLSTYVRDPDGRATELKVP